MSAEQFIPNMYACLSRPEISHMETLDLDLRSATLLIKTTPVLMELKIESLTISMNYYLNLLKETRGPDT